jgi:hypothetical protein
MYNILVQIGNTMGLHLVENDAFCAFLRLQAKSPLPKCLQQSWKKTYCLSHFFGTSNWPKLSSDFSGVHQKGLNLTS